MEALTKRPILSKPHEFVNMMSRRLDELDARARRSIWGQIQLDKARLSKSAAALSALSPLNVLTRGYSVTFSSDGKTVDDAATLKVGDTIRTKFHHGGIESTVDRIDT